jgi:hypothetical protein
VVTYDGVRQSLFDLRALVAHEVVGNFEFEL